MSKKYQILGQIFFLTGLLIIVAAQIYAPRSEYTITIIGIVLSIIVLYSVQVWYRGRVRKSLHHIVEENLLNDNIVDSEN